MMGFKSNQIVDVPADSLPAKLRELFADNCIQALPESIGQCSDLQKLMLAGNQLTNLPDSLARYHRLELARIAADQLKALSECLLPLPRLLWLAIGSFLHQYYFGLQAQ
ncbi:leucine-rich repeat domain-containing protein [Vibrio fluvialis]